MLLILIVKDVNTKDEIFFVTLLEIFFSVEGSYFAVVKSYAFKWIQTQMEVRQLKKAGGKQCVNVTSATNFPFLIITFDALTWADR